MILNLFKPRNSLGWSLFHIALGLATVFSNAFVIGWFYFILAGTVYLMAFSSVNRSLVLAATMAYLGAFELLARMTKCSPLIPWEASKYLFTILTLFGIYLRSDKPRFRYTGFWLILLAIPAIFLDRSGRVSGNEIIFNVMGIVNIGLGILFFSSLKIKKSRLPDLIRLILFPCITILTYTVIKTPDLKDINFLLGAQVVTSGEFGSNQVSTVLGLGFMLMSISCIMNWKVTSSRVLDGLAACAFLIQGLFTFSRGGMMSAGIALILFTYYLFFRSGYKARIPLTVKRYALPAFIVFTLAIFYANNITGGKLFLRYQGETEGTLLGSKEKTINTFTTNRNLIFMEDLDLWSEHPVFGVGAGASKYMRDEGRGLTAHVELSRLLAEHGIPGLIIFILLIGFGFSIRKETDPVMRAIKLGLYFLALFTTFHSATRTFITPLLLSMCSVNYIPDEKHVDSVPGK